MDELQLYARLGQLTLQQEINHNEIVQLKQALVNIINSQQQAQQAAVVQKQLDEEAAKQAAIHKQIEEGVDKLAEVADKAIEEGKKTLDV